MNQMPGMGGLEDNRNFIQNCQDWDRASMEMAQSNMLETAAMPALGLAPMTGAMENVGWQDEESFYLPLLKKALEMGLDLSIGDGAPDTKIKSGINALQTLRKKGGVFIKPYKNPKIMERMEWAMPVAQYFGVDIDAAAIKTMAGRTDMELKDLRLLAEIQEKSHGKGLPFCVKGVFTESDIELCQNLKPDYILVSNHGGRVKRPQGSTMEFLKKHSKVLENCCHSLWVDGGLRTPDHFRTAALLGAKKVLIGRPVITALLRDFNMSTET